MNTQTPTASGTGRRTVRGLIVASVLTAVAILGHAPRAQAQTVFVPAGHWGSPALIRCESRDFRRVFCAADLHGLDLHDFRQYSSSRCSLGHTFGFDPRGVWVSDGCRGEFLFRGAGRRGYYGDRGYHDDGRYYRDDRWRDRRGDGYGYGGGYGSGNFSVRCDSVKGRDSFCPAHLRGARLVGVRTLSRAQCIEGDSFQVQRSGIAVRYGCRGEFFFAQTGRGGKDGRWRDKDDD